MQNENKIILSHKRQQPITGIITGIQQVKINEDITPCAMIMLDEYKVVLPVDTLGVRNDIRVLRSIIGSEIHFVVTAVLKEKKVALGSREKAMALIREANKNKDLKGKTIKAKVTGIGRGHVYVEAFGVETTIAKDDVDYGFVSNLREYFSVGDSIQCKVKEADIENNKLELSIKDLKDNPYENLEETFPMKSENLATITNITDFGVFLAFDQNPQVTVLCPIPKWNNFSPNLRDKYVVRVKRIEEQKISGTLIRFVKRSEN